MAVKLIEVMSCDRCNAEIPRSAAEVARSGPDLAVVAGSPAWFPPIQFGDLCDDCRAVVAERLAQIARGSGWTVATGLTRDARPLQAARRKRGPENELPLAVEPHPEDLEARSSAAPGVATGAGVETAVAPSVSELVTEIAAERSLAELMAVANSVPGVEPFVEVARLDPSTLARLPSTPNENEVPVEPGQVDEGTGATPPPSTEGGGEPPAVELVDHLPLPELADIRALSTLGETRSAVYRHDGRWYSWTPAEGEVDHGEHEGRAHRAVELFDLEEL